MMRLLLLIAFYIKSFIYIRPSWQKQYTPLKKKQYARLLTLRWPSQLVEARWAESGLTASPVTVSVWPTNYEGKNRFTFGGFFIICFDRFTFKNGSIKSLWTLNYVSSYKGLNNILEMKTTFLSCVRIRLDLARIQNLI